MRDEPEEKPSRPNLPDYVLDPLERQSPEQLEAVATYASELATWKREQRRGEINERRAESEIGNEEKETLEERGISTEPEDYEDVPVSGAYITVKETKPGYRYYYWQWREGDSWKNEYIAPVSPGGE